MHWWCLSIRWLRITIVFHLIMLVKKVGLADLLVGLAVSWWLPARGLVLKKSICLALHEFLCIKYCFGSEDARCLIFFVFFCFNLIFFPVLKHEHYSKYLLVHLNACWRDMVLFSEKGSMTFFSPSMPVWIKINRISL